MIGAGLKNLDLVWYLVTEVLASRRKQHAVLQQFAPNAKLHDWHRITAGQRVQIMKRGADGKAVIQFGTEVVAGAMARSRVCSGHPRAPRRPCRSCSTCSRHASRSSCRRGSRS
ncbi:hypothetical protein GCM10025869_06730 [Homoserinibacter gongjuensis]|uniref:malate dehydrogenase (quinone) n=1 Tax=Homoserinibacter gongjuensis TaxID=1162968 RepID=A0ABQ6JS61_9MICO|nr:hypothetical protein GCM10025869_06730 [Homoserinibacter gongjuensis]